MGGCTPASDDVIAKRPGAWQAAEKNKPLIAALKSCATQNQGCGIGSLVITLLRREFLERESSPFVRFFHGSLPYAPLPARC
jgi:hypothetical protein